MAIAADSVITDVDDAKFNKAVRSWANGVKNKLAASARSKTTKGKKTQRVIKTKEEGSIVEKILSEDIRYSVKINYGIVERISFSFPRHGVFWHKGVGKGHPITNPRKAVDWFNSIIEQSIPELEEIIAGYYADAVVNATQILIE